MTIIYRILALFVFFGLVELYALVFHKRKATYRDQVTIAGGALLLSFIVVFAGPAYSYVTTQYQKEALNLEFVCPEHQTSQADQAYIYRYIEFYITHYPNMQLSQLLTMRYDQLVEHNCTTTLEHIANSPSAGGAASSSSDPTLRELDATGFGAVQ